MAGFQTASDFTPNPAVDLRLLPLRFERLGTDRFLVANMVGDLLLLTGEELTASSPCILRRGRAIRAGFQKLLVAGKDQRSQLQLLALRLRTAWPSCARPTALHLFVVTLRCEHSCPYCQVSRRSVDHERYDMSEETGDTRLVSRSRHRRRPSRSSSKAANLSSTSVWCERSSRKRRTRSKPP